MKWKEIVREQTVVLNEDNSTTNLMLMTPGSPDDRTNILLLLDLSSSIPRLVIQHLFGDWEKMNAFPEEVVMEMVKKDQSVWRAFKNSIIKSGKLLERQFTIAF